MTRRRRARAALGLLAGLLLLQPLVGCGSEERATPRAQGRWEVELRETFDGDALDAELWGTCHWWSRDGGCTILSNDEVQWYQPDQVAVGDGSLQLTAIEAPSQHLGRSFTHASGMVSSGRPGDETDDVARYAFTYGSVEVRFRAPKGAGLWPAVWMLPVTNESLPEIDLIEQYGDDTREISTTLHTAVEDPDDSRVDREYHETPDLSEGWHTIGIDWQRGSLTWFLDGEEIHRVEGDHVPAEPMYLVANLALGGRAGDVDPDAIPATFLIDEITVWRER